MARTTKKKRRDPPALLAGTSSQYLGERPLPKVLRTRAFVLILGPRGSGKSAVARQVLPDAITLRGDKLDTEAARAVRRRKWPDELQSAPELIIDGPSFLSRRAGVRRLLEQLLSERAEAGLRTTVVQGPDDSALLLADAVQPHQRATVNLRFPQRRGRQRFTRLIAAELGSPLDAAEGLVIEEPWTYLKVIRALHRLKRQG